MVVYMQAQITRPLHIVSETDLQITSNLWIITIIMTLTCSQTLWHESIQLPVPHEVVQLHTEKVSTQTVYSLKCTNVKSEYIVKTKLSMYN